MKSPVTSTPYTRQLRRVANAIPTSLFVLMSEGSTPSNIYGVPLNGRAAYKLDNPYASQPAASEARGVTGVASAKQSLLMRAMSTPQRSRTSLGEALNAGDPNANAYVMPANMIAKPPTRFQLI